MRFIAIRIFPSLHVARSIFLLVLLFQSCAQSYNRLLLSINNATHIFLGLSFPIYIKYSIYEFVYGTWRIYTCTEHLHAKESTGKKGKNPPSHIYFSWWLRLSLYDMYDIFEKIMLQVFKCVLCIIRVYAFVCALLHEDAEYISIYIKPQSV